MKKILTLVLAALLTTIQLCADVALPQNKPAVKPKAAHHGKKAAKHHRTSSNSSPSSRQSYTGCRCKCYKACPPESCDCPAALTSDNTTLFNPGAEMYYDQIRQQLGTYDIPESYSFANNYGVFLAFEATPATQVPSGSGIQSPPPLFMQDKIEEYHTLKGTLNLYKAPANPAGPSSFFLNVGGASAFEGWFLTSFALEDRSVKYIVVQEAPAYGGPVLYNNLNDIDNVWILRVIRNDPSKTVIQQINEAVVNLNSGKNVNGTTVAAPRRPPISSPSNWKIIEWMVAPNNPGSYIPTVNHDLDSPAGAIGWDPRKIIVIDFAFATPGNNLISPTNVPFPPTVQECNKLVDDARATVGNGNVLSFGSISKALGLTSNRTNYLWLPYEWVTSRPNWYYWFDRTSAQRLTGPPNRARQDLLNRMQFEIETDLGETLDQLYNENNILLQKTIVKEFQTKYGASNVRLINNYGANGINLLFEEPFATTLRGSFPTIAAYFSDLLKMNLASGAGFYNFLSAPPSPALTTYINNFLRLPTNDGVFVYTAFLNRLVGFNKYAPEDFLKIPKNEIALGGKIVTALKSEALDYTLSIANKTLLVDATCNKAVIHLPNLVSFPCIPYVFKIKNISKNSRDVLIESVRTVTTPFSYTLAPGKSVRVEWTSQANLNSGKWIIAECSTK